MTKIAMQMTASALVFGSIAVAIPIARFFHSFEILAAPLLAICFGDWVQEKFPLYLFYYRFAGKWPRRSVMILALLLVVYGVSVRMYFVPCVVNPFVPCPEVAGDLSRVG